VPLWSFTSAIALARLIRYFGVGYLAVKYGKDTLPMLERNKLTAAVGLAAFAVLSYLASRWILSRRHRVEGNS